MLVSGELFYSFLAMCYNLMLPVAIFLPKLLRRSDRHLSYSQRQKWQLSDVSNYRPIALVTTECSQRYLKTCC